MNYIINPLTGNKLNIHSNDAKNLLKSYVKLLNGAPINGMAIQSGGGNIAKNQTEGTLYYFSMKGCGHCTEFNKTWPDVENRVTSMGISTKKNLTSDSISDLASEYGVVSFPTLIYENKNGEKKTYSGDRTVKNIVKFVKENKYY